MVSSGYLGTEGTQATTVIVIRLELVIHVELLPIPWFVITAHTQLGIRVVTCYPIAAQLFYALFCCLQLDVTCQTLLRVLSTVVAAIHATVQQNPAPEGEGVFYTYGEHHGVCPRSRCTTQSPF